MSEDRSEQRQAIPASEPTPVSGTGLFGMGHLPDEAHVIVIPVPFAATCSYGSGAENGPAAVLAASPQIDAFDPHTRTTANAGKAGEPLGIAMLEESTTVRRWHDDARRLTTLVRTAPGSRADALREANELCERVDTYVYTTAREWLERGRSVALVGGDHATAFGAIRAHAERYPGLGILHVDAHADLREAYEGFVWSHASIMYNVLERVPGVSKIVQVGIRDFCEEEYTRIQQSSGRVSTFFDADLAERQFDGETWNDQVKRIVDGLPRDVYVSFDIDGLEPSLCPHTGTPVPGGLTFNQAVALIAAVPRSGRRIVGVDLTEVAPGPEGDEWDGNVAMRILYKLLSWMMASAPR